MPDAHAAAVCQRNHCGHPLSEHKRRASPPSPDPKVIEEWKRSAYPCSMCPCLTALSLDEKRRMILAGEWGTW